ncbi:MAG: acetoacetate--CoA ligase [Bryobacterales bacterium]|nr:acetoacetate--CoA ligase [Bryobacterales bacterium]
MNPPLWTPSPERIEQANVTSFIRSLARQGHPVRDYPSLYEWSCSHPEEFWVAVWDRCRVIAERPWDAVLENPDEMPGARWFQGTRLNFAENLLRYHDQREAIIAWNEHGRYATWTFSGLRLRVAHIAHQLKLWGVGPGDRVVGFMPNIPETVVAMLAATTIGATWSSCSPDFGTQGVLDRFEQLAPKVLFAAAAVEYAGKRFDLLGRLKEIEARLPSLEHCVLVPYLAPDAQIEGERWIRFDQCLSDVAPADPEFVPLPFDHPIYVMFSSGTTGVPKGIVHGAGGTLIQHLKEHTFHCDLRPGDRVFYFTTLGWMMWNWLVSTLATGSTIVLYDGSPFHPKPDILWDMAAEERITVFGTSPRYLTAIEKAGVRPTRTHNLEHLRTVLSTGSPLMPESFDYVYREIKEDVCLSSVSGGTDLLSCFAGGNPALPVYRGELQCLALAMKVEVWDDDGKPVFGQKGELVCTKPFPSMPVGFWNDPDGAKYRAAYFEHFPGVWRHGDYAEITPSGGMIIHGRSDAVLNPGGVRIGTAEIYRVLQQLPEIEESMVVGQQWDGDVRVVLFVRLAEGVTLDDPLRDRIRAAIRAQASPRHVPSKILAVTDIPRTVSGKITEIAVRDLIHGRAVKNTEALANPEALEQFRNREELAV